MELAGSTGAAEGVHRSFAAKTAAQDDNVRGLHNSLNGSRKV
jgi:hypothetical protein